MGIAVLTAVAFLAVCVAVYYFVFRKAAKKSPPDVPAEVFTQADSGVTYAPPEFEWSGHSSGLLPVKTLTYKQYECLEDARYGFRIVGVSPTARKAPQPHKTRAHGLKTVTSLSRHGFVTITPDGAYTITDHGLNALAVCNVRY